MNSPGLLAALFDLPALSWGEWRLADPAWLAAAVLVPLALLSRRQSRPEVWLVPFSAAWYKPTTFRVGRLPLALLVLAALLTIVALSRPQRVEDKRQIDSKGYDIVLAIDLSKSMLQADYERDGRPVNRLQAIQPVVQAFVTRRPHDRIALVVFSGRAYTLAPLTFDHDWLARQLERLRIGLIEDGTAIGDGLGVALTRLEQRSREEAGLRQGAFVVLLTDGANNRGNLAPRQAAELARARGIPIYTIGAGRNRLYSDLDEEMLQNVARMTGGQYFFADEVRTVERAFAAIDKAKKIEFQAQSYYLTTELFPWFAAPAGLLMIAVGLLVWRRPSLSAA